MTKTEFLATMARAYDFPDHFGGNLDAANDALYDLREAAASGAATLPKLSLLPFFRELLGEEAQAEACLALLREHFGVE